MICKINSFEFFFNKLKLYFNIIGKQLISLHYAITLKYLITSIFNSKGITIQIHYTQKEKTAKIAISFMKYLQQ